MYRADPATPTEPYDPRIPHTPQPPQPGGQPAAQPPIEPPAPEPAAEIPPLGALGAPGGTPSPGAAQASPNAARPAHAPLGYAPRGYAAAGYAPTATDPRTQSTAYPRTAYPRGTPTWAAPGYVDPRLTPMAPPANAPADAGHPANASPYPTSAVPGFEQSPGIPVAPAPEPPAAPTPRPPDYEALIYETPAHGRHAATPYDPYHRMLAASAAEPRQPLRAAPRGLYAWNGIRTIHFILGVIEVLLAIRFVLMLFAASSTAPFARLVFGITFPLVAPFNGVFPEGGGGGHIFDATAILAGIIYALIAWGITSLLHLEARRRNPMAPIDPLIPPQEPPPTPPSLMDDSMLP